MMTNAEIHVRSYQAISTLQSRATAVAQEHRERIKRLRDVARQIEQNSVSGQLDLGDIAPSIAPEIMELITNPTHGL